MRLPVPADPKLKDPSTFKLIGKEGVVKRLDSAIKSNGTAQYTLDINDPGTLTALIARSARFGGVVGSFDAAAAFAISDVVDVEHVANDAVGYAQRFLPA